MNYDDIIGSDSDREIIYEKNISPKEIHIENSEVQYLVELREKVQGYIGFTLNHPRTLKFLNARSNVQKKMYLLWFMEFKNTFGHTEKDSECDIIFEYCKSGQVHAHGWIRIKDKGFVNGFISDFAKSVLQFLPKKHMQFKEACLFPQYQRYKCPSCCIQWYDNNLEVMGPEGITHWKTYMKKSQN